jgi:AcrR family transcriptional regulator
MNPGGQRRAAGEGDGAVRERLIAAAAGIVRAGGTASATSRAITDRAGENLAAITYYFGSKDALVSEALIRQARSLVQPVVDELASDRPPAAKLLAAVQMLTDLLAARRDQLACYLECLARSPRDDRVAAEVCALSADVRRHLADEMARQRAQHLIPGWVDPPAMAALIAALANGVVAGVVVDPDGADPAAIAGQFAALLLAVRSPAPAEPGGPAEPRWPGRPGG